MDMDKRIPLVVGVTGHRSLRPEDREALYASVTRELEALQRRCPSSPLVMLTSLAEGGDLLCADAAQSLGIPLLAALPMERSAYAADFSAEALRRFDAHCARAEKVFVAPFTEAAPETDDRDFRYRQAGIYVAAHCHVLLALWDGGAGTAAACGTAEAVDFALHGSYCPAGGMPLRDGGNLAVLHIFTPRGDRTGESAGTVRVLGDWQAVEDLLEKTDRFNRQAAVLDLPAGGLLPEDSREDASLRRMEALYRAADALSGLSARRYRRVLALLAAASTLLTMAFLLYDEAQAIGLIFVCGAMLLAAVCCQRYARRSDCHRQYIEYRTLAECLRVQCFLRYAGSGVGAQELLPWTEQEECAWVLAALCALAVGPAAERAHDIRACWVEQQRSYHQRALSPVGRDLRLSERTVRTAMLCSVALYLAAVLFEMLFGGMLWAAPFPVADSEWYRTVLKIAMGSLSAMTLFVANYYGRLSLDRKLADHAKMERFYRKMAGQLALRGQTEALLIALAREELIENGNWGSYQRDNKPDFSF